MASAKDKPTPAQINRREILSTVPVATVALGLAVAAGVEASSETPIQRLFREWADYRAWINGPGSRGMHDNDFNLLVDKMDAMAEALLPVPCQTPQDFIMKVIAATDWGAGGMPNVNEMPELWAEARALVGAA